MIASDDAIEVAAPSFVDETGMAQFANQASCHALLGSMKIVPWRCGITGGGGLDWGKFVGRIKMLERTETQSSRAADVV